LGLRSKTDCNLEPYPKSRATCPTQADLKDFSKLREDEMPPFVEHYLGMIAALLAEFSHSPVLFPFVRIGSKGAARKN
jgi:hypothetical protein